MANNKIIVSSGNGTYQETTSSFSIDNDNGIISASSAVVATSSLPTDVSGVLQVYKGRVIPLWLTSSIWDNFDNDNNQLTTWDGDFSKGNLSGTLFQYRNDLPITIDGKDYNGFGPHRVASASFNGDIIGTVSASVPVKIISVANVTGGILDSRFGGTSTSSFENGAIVTLSGSGFKPSDGENNVIGTDVNGNWSLANKTSIQPTDTYLTSTLVYLYTGSVNNINYNALTESFTWIKPGSVSSLISQKPRFIRVICQGAGGGGARPVISTTGLLYAYGGSGGGYSDVTYSPESIEDSITISVGRGGLGAISAGTAGGSGGPTLFGSYVSGATGGAGGSISSSATTVYPRSGIGYNYLGGSGSNGNNATAQDINCNVVLGGAGGGGGGSWVSYPGRTGGSITSLNLTASVQPVSLLGQNALPPMSGTMFGFTKCILNDVQNSNFPYLIYAGGTGGNGSAGAGLGGSGSSPLFGSGGGGGGRSQSGTTGNGGNGGSGYVLIICT